MSYDLLVPHASRSADDTDSVLAEITRVAPSERVRQVAARQIACDGGGFTIEATAGGVKLSASGDRGEHDEVAMECAAAWFAGSAGTVVDRHAGRTWPAAVLSEWLATTGTLSGRALAINEERIRHERAPRALRGFSARMGAIADHIVAGGSTALRARVHDELVFYASRPALAWTVAPALARLGDFSRLEALAFVTPPDGTPDAFSTAARIGRTALPMFARALEEPDPNRRRLAAAALHVMCDPGVLPLVLRALDDRRATVREVVLGEGFGEFLKLEGARDELGPALERLAHDVNTTVRTLAARWAWGRS